MASFKDISISLQQFQIPYMVKGFEVASQGP